MGKEYFVDLIVNEKISSIIFSFLKKTMRKKSFLLYYYQCCKLLQKRSFSQNKSARDYQATMKLNSAEFHSVFTPELRKLESLFTNYGYEIRIVGGAVRDLLTGKRPYDLDFATTATPDQMKNMFETENIRMLKNKGEKHGTITPRINDKENFEVTTLRTDVSTDGRHAEVEFTTDWELDAARRDLTINSMYLGFDGTLYDYFNGYQDLKNKKVLFVGDPASRIKEDYLRILRYFRFFGKITNDPSAHDQPTLKAIQDNAPGLEKVSGERIWSELSKILIGNYVEEIIKTMLNIGLGPLIKLNYPDELDIKSFENICRHKSKFDFKPITYIAALLQTEDEILDFHFRVRLSSYERDLALFLIYHKSKHISESSENELKAFQYLLVRTKFPKEQMRDYINELLKFKNQEELLQKFQSVPVPVFPLNGNILKSQGIKNGKQIGIILDKLKQVWMNSDFQLTKEDLILKLPEMLPDKKTK